MNKGYKQLAKYYDKLYGWKDYKLESEKINSLIKKYKTSEGREMLDVACGTGNHMEYLKKYYNITGLDIDKDMLKMAKKKFPDIKFCNGDMRTFDMKKKYDVIVCLFAAIAHLTKKSDLKKVIRNFASHLNEGGVMLIEGFITPGAYTKNFVNAIFVNEPDLKICRMNITTRRNNIVTFRFHVLVGESMGVKYLTEDHSLAMHEHHDFLEIMKGEGLKAMNIKNGLMKNRDLYIGIKK